MKIYGRYLFIAFIWGCIFSLYGAMYTNGTFSLQQLAVDISFGIMSACNRIIVVVLLERMVPYIIFIVLFSTYIYQHFCYSSVYFFSRCTKRWQWFIREQLKLLAYALTYMIFMITGRIFPYVFYHKFSIDMTGIKTICIIAGIFSIWLFTASSIGNTLSILIGGLKGVICTIGIIILSVFSLMWTDTNNMTKKEIIKLRMNYNSVLVFDWHKYGNITTSGTSCLHTNFKYASSYIFAIGVMLAVIVTGIYIINRADIISESREE